QGCFEAPIIINAAGVYADELHNMVSERKLHITARRGEYCLMDRAVGNLVSSTIFKLPTKMGKGILVTPTVHGNLLIGPTAEDVEDKEAVNTTGPGIEKVTAQAAESVKNLPVRSVITSFAGLRAHEAGGDFVIGEAEDAPGFIDVAGIESPGLTCAPAIGVYVAELLNHIHPAPLKSDFKATRKGVPSISLATDEERQRLIKENPAFANVICRCEQVTEGEILAAIHRPLGATTLDGIKRRTRAGMGRCQAGFCSPKTVEILARELQVDMARITKAGEGSEFLTGYNKEQEKAIAAYKSIDSKEVQA
ncbi:MAG: NAD(P)/FAD-dependent oxidoreductase, partial [Lachnospiraceae bacterium]